ncbi:MAG: hypothetical protein K0V04_01200 [Deltaproteobacteria bacterium]|nr:hypothetical protein [Deltaproteobacteria bacterium]
MPRPHPTAPVLAAVVLLAGILQVMATVLLGLASIDELRSAAAEGARFYLLGALGTLLGLSVVWMLRRTVLIAAIVLVVWQAAVFWPLYSRTSALGLAFHGEYVLHHFTGLIAAATCVAIGTGWLRRADLGKQRMLPAGLALLGTAALLASHVLEQPNLGGDAPAWLERGGTAALLLAWGTAIPVFWTQLGPPRGRIIAIALLLPYLVRVGFAWPDGLAGASVADMGRPFVMATMVATAITVFFLFRPSVAQGVRVLVLTFSGLATVLLYYFYWRGFGELEAGLGGLAQSMFAFSLPYPTYVSKWQVWIVMLGMFAMFSAAYAGLVGPGQRVRGVALALLVVTGLGLSTPPLAMMTAAAGLLWIDSLTGSTSQAASVVPPSIPIAELLEATAERLDAPGLVVLDEGRDSLLAVRGDVSETPVDIKARSARADVWDVTIVVGTLGRSRPDLALLPHRGDDGHRPAHLLGRTHRARGRVRDLELLDDTLLDALLPFPDARIEMWEAGTRMRMGRDLSQLDDERLAVLVRELVRRE